MTASTLALIVLSLLLGFAAWLIFLWAVRGGQMDDIERPKHRMLDDEDEPERPRARDNEP